MGGGCTARTFPCPAPHGMWPPPTNRIVCTPSLPSQHQHDAPGHCLIHPPSCMPLSQPSRTLPAFAPPSPRLPGPSPPVLCVVLQPLPWRHVPAGTSRVVESVRPVFWSNRPKAYVKRTQVRALLGGRLGWRGMRGGGGIHEVPCAARAGGDVLMNSCVVYARCGVLNATQSAFLLPPRPPLPCLAPHCRLRRPRPPAPAPPQEWDSYPAGRWGNSRSPAYGSLVGHPFMRRHTTSDARKVGT